METTSNDDVSIVMMSDIPKVLAIAADNISVSSDTQMLDESTVTSEVVTRTNNSLVHRLAIRLTLVLTIPKTEDSLRYLKQVCDTVGIGNLYFYTVQDSKNKPTEKQVKYLLAEYGVKYFKYIQTNGCDAEVMNREKITHIIDDRPGWLVGMLTYDGYVVIVSHQIQILSISKQTISKYQQNG